MIFFFLCWKNPEQISQFTLDKASYSSCTQCLLSCMCKFTSWRETARNLLQGKAYVRSQQSKCQ